MSIRRGLTLTAAVFAIGAWVTTPAPGGTNYGYQHLATSCVLTETSWGQLVAARTSWRMWSHRSTSSDGYRWQARLIPTRPGLNLHRAWKATEVDGLGSAGPRSYDAAVTTPAVSGNLDWDLQIKLTWDRADSRDSNVEHVLPFDESTCRQA
jgi:hypothetical protein